MKIAIVIGARPQIIKAAALSRAIKNVFSTQIEEIIIHTGQHFDENMSDIFFAELQIPMPTFNLNCHAGSTDAQMEVMRLKLSSLFTQVNPDAVVVFGDTNSTLAGSLAAYDLHIPLIHIEAGLRSFNMEMPEERNRYESDHLSTLLFAPTDIAIQNLKDEKLGGGSPPFSKNNPCVFHCGDVMFDNTLFFKELSYSKSHILSQLKLENSTYILATIHRNFNTDNETRLSAIFEALCEISKHIRVVLPLHPRTQKAMKMYLKEEQRQKIENTLSLISPLSFLEMTLLEANCELIITDSGGVQKEAFFFKKPSVILRPETEWIEIVTCGAATLADASYDKIVADTYMYLHQKPTYFPEIFGNGKAAEQICQQIIQWYNSLNNKS